MQMSSSSDGKNSQVRKQSAPGTNPAQSRSRKRIEIPENQEELKAQRAAKKQKQITKSREDYRKITQAGIAQWVQDFKAGKIVFSSVSDLRQLIELDMELQERE